jgi:hypothetical protein
VGARIAERMSAARVEILFAPGAGAPSSSAWMRAWASRLEALGAVTRFDYDYMREGRRRPDAHDALVRTHRAALDAAFARAGAPIVLAGKSMGSRIGCHVAVTCPGRVSCLVCFGYPLRSAQTGRLRDAVLRDLRTPILFLQGTRDALCPLDELGRVREQMAAKSDLFVVESGDHSLEITAAHRKSTGETQADVDARVLDAIAAFVRSCDVGRADPG